MINQILITHNFKEMKKFLLFAGVAATMLTSCSSEEVVEISKSDEITFRTAMALNEASRGTEISNTTISQFLATAVEQSPDGGGNLFNNVIFRKSSENTEFKSDKSYLWYKDANLKFYALSYNAPNNTDISVSKIGKISINTTEAKIYQFSPQQEISDQIDLVGATAEATYSAREGAVSLTFSHLLSEIQVMAMTGNTTYEFYVKGVKFCNVGAEADYDFNATTTNGGWSLNPNKIATYEVRYDEPVRLNATQQNISNTGNVGYAMLIPQTLEKWDVVNDKHNDKNKSYLAVLLQIKVKDDGMQVFPLTRKDAAGNVVYNDGKYAWACIPIDDAWQSRHRITYVLDFTNGAGYTDPDPNPNPDPDPDDPIAYPDPDDEGKPILDGLIKCTVKVDDWIHDKELYPNTVGPNTK